MPYGDGGMVEDRLWNFLDARYPDGSRVVPLESIGRELARIAPSCVPREMGPGEIVRVLGVAGIAALAGVRRSTVLESAGPESCAIADLIVSNPFGHLENASGGGCGPCSCRSAYGPGVPALEMPGRGVRFPGGYGAPDPYYPDPGYSVDYSGRPVPSADPREAGRASGADSRHVEPELKPSYGDAVASGTVGGGSFGGSAQLAETWTPELSTSYGASYSTGTGQRGERTRTPGALSTSYGASYSTDTAGERTRSAVDRRRRNPWSEDLEAALSGTYEPEPGEGAPVVSGAGGSTFTGWPGAVPFRRDAWNFSESWYILQSGDTFSGLAATYLGSPARWMEIWQLQPYRYTEAPDPSSVKPGRPLVRVGERVVMPEEATDRARELVSTGAPSAPAIGGVGGSPKGAGAPWSTGTKLAIGVGVLGLLGVGAYAVSSS